ncbi:twitching motility protein PilI [Duganella sp. 1224]|uniref:chemotaxis protein CheW n=1 Tax=Duganella sp. 1224 TaxID=2587052 RepID=UPI0015C6E6C8|nr:chemotaxis protein CheW [Duganella sp. 1224]NYE61831.1 twitching motility protein PilI [Duganella sp. 1224]
MDRQAPTERRSRLRQYQVQLLERMQAARSGAAEGGRELGVRLGGRLCLLDLTQISEIVPLQPITPVPLTQEWYLGLVNIRGHLTGVIDLARYHGQAAGDSAPSERRLITFAPSLGFNCALLVERVLGLRKLAEMTPRQDAPLEFVDADGQPWTRIDLAQLVLEPRFSQVGLI